jgi:hypothetical protein
VPKISKRTDARSKSGGRRNWSVSGKRQHREESGEYSRGRISTATEKKLKQKEEI